MTKRIFNRILYIILLSIVILGSIYIKEMSDSPIFLLLLVIYLLSTILLTGISIFKFQEWYQDLPN